MTHRAVLVVRATCAVFTLRHALSLSVKVAYVPSVATAAVTPSIATEARTF